MGKESAAEDLDTETKATEDAVGAEEERGAEDPDAIAPPWSRKPAANAREWIAGAPLSARVHLALGLLLPAFVLSLNMARIWSFTIDDAYISYRYARNLARGLGLVYNAGERIEGYTNFLWTVILALFVKLGVDPDVAAKVLGGAAAQGALVATYVLANRLRPFAVLPCIATWLLASTIVFSGYAVFGLETSFFVCLLLCGTTLFLQEEGAYAGASAKGGRGFPWSGVVFGLAGLTRPEAPMFIGLLMLFLGRGIFSRKNLLRGALFAAPVAAHLAFRRLYYGSFLPNTLSAKTGNLRGQIDGGLGYVENYVNHAGPVLWLALFAIATGLIMRRRDLLAIATIAAAVLGYVVLVGGDWMPYFRFMAPFEPFCFLLVDVAARTIADRKSPAANLALAGFLFIVAAQRTGNLRGAQRGILEKEERFWTMAAGGTARWFLDHGKPGEIAIGDIGYVGWATDYPILDLLGLVDPVISKLEGGYTRKLGPGFLERFFSKRPDYFLLISANNDCVHPSVPGSQVIYRDPRFRPAYELAGKVPLDGGFNWCIYQRHDRTDAAPSR